MGSNSTGSRKRPRSSTLALAKYRHTAKRPRLSYAAQRAEHSIGVASDPNYIDYDFPGTTVNNSVNPVNLVPLGTSLFSRLGNKVFMKYCRVRGRISQASGVDNPTSVKFALVYDKSSNGSTPSYQDIFKGFFSGTSYTTEPYSFGNTTMNDRFTILRDEFFILGGEGLSSYSGTPQDHIIDWYVPLKLSMKYNAVTNTPEVMGDLISGGLYLVFITDGAPTFNGTARVCFKP